LGIALLANADLVPALPAYQPSPRHTVFLVGDLRWTRRDLSMLAFIGAGGAALVDAMQCV
jgi:hypothetical protein